MKITTHSPLEMFPHFMDELHCSPDFLTNSHSLPPTEHPSLLWIATLQSCECLPFRQSQGKPNNNLYSSINNRSGRKKTKSKRTRLAEMPWTNKVNPFAICIFGFYLIHRLSCRFWTCFLKNRETSHNTYFFHRCGTQHVGLIP